MGALDQAVDVAMKRSVFHRDRPGSQKRQSGFSERFAVGYVEELEQPKVAHAVAVTTEQNTGRLNCLVRIEMQKHLSPLPIGPADPSIAYTGVRMILSSVYRNRSFGERIRQCKLSQRNEF